MRKRTRKEVQELFREAASVTPGPVNSRRRPDLDPYETPGAFQHRLALGVPRRWYKSAYMQK